MADKITIKPGEEWFITSCHGSACGRTLLIAPVLPEMLDAAGGVTIDFAPQKVKCPHCGNESVYQKEELRREKAQRFQ
jgi:predicted RNA-binding Zn-ribbon protein involved in translation (DUF1610 family)